MTPPRILIVDDHATNIELTRFVLEADGLLVDAASNAKQALQHIRVVPPDLVLMDILMPGIDGLDLTRRLKADPATRAIVVVAFTAYAMKGDEARLRSAGCDGYLAKPINVALFANQVRALLASGVQAARPGLPPQSSA